MPEYLIKKRTRELRACMYAQWCVLCALIAVLAIFVNNYIYMKFELDEVHKRTLTIEKRLQLDDIEIKEKDIEKARNLQYIFKLILKDN